MRLPVEYKLTNHRNRLLYNCCISNVEFLRLNYFNLKGEHIFGKTKNDVTAVKFENCTMTKVPQNFTKHFPNLKVLIISDSNLENIAREDLMEYKELDTIEVSMSLILVLPGDLFEGFHKLEAIYFGNNSLRTVEPNILDRLYKLQYACFGFYNEDKVTFCKKSQSYKDFREELLKRFCSSSEEIIQNFIQKTEQNVQKFRKMKENLSQKVQKLEASHKKFNEQNSELNRKIKVGDCYKAFSTYYQYENEELKQKIENMNKTGFFGDLKKFVQDETTKDFKIVIDDREFPVHKFLLAARSPTLAEILRNNPEVENLNLVDISVEIFEKILKFLYTDELPREDGTNFLHLFAAAGRLKIKELKHFAAVKISGQISAENALEILKLSNKYKHEQLRQKAFEEVKRKYPKIGFEDEWIGDTDKISKIVEAFEKKEEEMRELEEKFKNFLGGK